MYEQMEEFILSVFFPYLEKSDAVKYKYNASLIY